MTIRLKRGAVREAGASEETTVPLVPEETLAPTGGPRWIQSGPAPAGALLRGYRSSDDAVESGARSVATDDDETFVSRRSIKIPLWRRLPVSTAGRIALGTGVFAGLAAIAIVFAEGRDVLLHDSRFEITSSSEIETSGNEHLTRAQLLRVFGADIERNIFRVPLGERREDLERLPWVEKATVMRLLPNRLRVQIRERVPVAFVRQGTRVGLVDSHGILLDMPAAPDSETYSFPVLTGFSSDDPLDTRAARMALYGDFMKALAPAGKDAAKSLSEVDLSDPEDVRALVLQGPTEVLVHFGDEDYLKRYQAFAAHADEWRQQHPRLASVDMRYDGQVVLGMGAATPAVASAPVAQPAPGSKAPLVARADMPALLPVPPVARVTAPLLPKPASVSTSATPKATPAPSKPAVVKASADVVRKPAVKAALAHSAAHQVGGKGFSTSNERMFAALAAEHRALAKQNSQGVAR